MDLRCIYQTQSYSIGWRRGVRRAPHTKTAFIVMYRVLVELRVLVSYVRCIVVEFATRYSLSPS
jgi:hypothetical protein